MGWNCDSTFCLRELHGYAHNLAVESSVKPRRASVWSCLIKDDLRNNRKGLGVYRATMSSDFVS